MTFALEIIQRFFYHFIDHCTLGKVTKVMSRFKYSPFEKTCIIELAYHPANKIIYIKGKQDLK